MTLKTTKQGLLNADLKRNLNLFVGAGFSTLAGSKLSDSLPRGECLKNLLIDKFNLLEYKSLDLPSIYALILSDRREYLRKYLEEMYKVEKYDHKYDALRSLSVDFIYTTNIDDLPFHIFNARNGDSARVLHDNYFYGSPRQPSQVIQFISLHGNVRHEDADFLFTAGQMSSAFASDRETWYVFQRELQARPTFFLGYGLRDAGVLQALHDVNNRGNSNRWILLHEEDNGAVALYESLGFEIIIGGIEDFLSYVELNKSSNTKATPISEISATGMVPISAQVAKRPIKSFFLGAEPEWSDAYSNQVVRRRVNALIKNSIYSGKHVALVGLPLSGKTTILKQIATEVSSDRLSLYFDKINGPIADKIIAEHKDSEEKPYIFIDSMLDSRDSINKLYYELGAQIICSEQSIYFDAVNLKIPSDSIDVHSCSEIGNQDLQNIISSIPTEIRRFHHDNIDIIENDASGVGLFESFRRHVYDQALLTRFREKLSEFEERDSEAFDVYLMACYVAACRSIVSYDMIFMFLDRRNKEYGDVYKIIERIQGFLKDVELPDDPHQDYFSVRSNALARIALKECQSRSFSRVFDRFHSSVPTRVIVDYNTFKRYAYDNDYARKAYPVARDGIKFYERLVRLSDSPYDYQHGAIYLSRMKHFQEAFTWIDNAVSKSGGRLYPIRNTHARILFEANFDILKSDPDNSTALSGIDQSMKVLEYCIENDSKRSYHIFRFCDQSLIYSELKSDDRAYKWLENSRDRLKAMLERAKVQGSRESYNFSKYKSLLSQVNSALSSFRVN